MTISMSKQTLGYSTLGPVTCGYSFLSRGHRPRRQGRPPFRHAHVRRGPGVLEGKHLGAKGGLLRFLQAGKELPVADWISPDELGHAQSYPQKPEGTRACSTGTRRRRCMYDPADEDRALTAEERKITVCANAAGCDGAGLHGHRGHAGMQMTRAVAEDLTVERGSRQGGHWAMLEAKDEVEQLLLEDFGTTRCV